MTNINFNFTFEQHEEFNKIYEETSKLYPHLIKDDVMKERVKVLIAYTVINPTNPLEILIDLDKTENNNI